MILNPDLLSLVQDKSIALVGPAGYLTDENQGAKIDGHDIVIRPNSFSIPAKLHSDYGSRTDIMFHNFGTPWMAGLRDQISKSPKDFAALKMLACPVIKASHQELDYMSWAEDKVSDVVKNAESVNEYNIPFYWIGIKDYQKLATLMDCQPYTGILTLAILLEYPIKELYMTGFSFYQDVKGRGIYHDGALSDLDSYTGNHGGDTEHRQMQFVQTLYNKLDSSLFEVDNVMKSSIIQHKE
tara:strand:+ start:38839 stop:39558 length:720 start_codon:yes stop_codon:yes gene_type:complete